MSFEYRVKRVLEKEERRIMKDFINYNHSYISYADRPSRKLYWMLYENDLLVGVFGLGSAFSQPKQVKQYMKIHSLAFNEIGNNIVFCLSHHENKNAGSKLLSLVRKDAILWWYERYGDVLKAFQTFVLPPRKGSVYRADNWECIGSTVGATQQTICIRPDDIHKYEKVHKKKFKDGREEYFIRQYKESEPKLIFMKLNKTKEVNKLRSK